jgi:hypothetical protein
VVKVEFKCLKGEPDQWAEPAIVELSRVPCIGEWVYAVMFLGDTTWEVEGVTHRDFAVDGIHAIVVVKRP